MPVLLDGAHGGVAARTRALDLDLGALQTVLHGGAAGLLGGELCGERGALAAALVPDGTGRRPGDDVALGVGDRDDRVVERALDVHHTGAHVLAVTLARPTRLRLAWPLLPHCLLLVGNRALRALAGAGVGVGALTTDRQTLAVTDALQAADLDLALDVALHVAAQVALDLQVLVDVGTDPVDLVLGQVRDLGVRVELERSAQIFCDVVQADPKM